MRHTYNDHTQNYNNQMINNTNDNNGDKTKHADDINNSNGNNNTHDHNHNHNNTNNTWKVPNRGSMKISMIIAAYKQLEATA